MIDAHIHLWPLDAYAGTWPTPAEGQLSRTWKACGLRALSVRSREGARDAAGPPEVAVSDAGIAGVAGWADPDDPAVLAALPRREDPKGLGPIKQHRSADRDDRTVSTASLAAMADHGVALHAVVTATAAYGDGLDLPLVPAIAHASVCGGEAPRCHRLERSHA